MFYFIIGDSQTTGKRKLIPRLKILVPACLSIGVCCIIFQRHEVMNMDISMRAIAHIQSEFPTKFGVPRQSGLVPSLESTVVFTPEFRNSDHFSFFHPPAPLCTSTDSF